MGMETTWDEIRVTTLQKMHLIEGNEIIYDDSTKEHLAAMPAVYNEAIRLLSTANRYITKYFEVTSDGLTHTLQVDLNKIVDDLFQIKPGSIYFTDETGTVSEYMDEDYLGNNYLLLSGSKCGTYRVYYYAYPMKVTAETEGSEDLQIDPDVASLVPLYMASQLWKEDEAGLSITYRNEFEVGRELLASERNSCLMASFKNTTGWY